MAVHTGAAASSRVTTESVALSTLSGVAERVLTGEEQRHPPPSGAALSLPSLQGAPSARLLQGVHVGPHPPEICP